MVSMVEVLKNAGIFMILAQAVIHFRPEPSYEKYFRFMAGIMTSVIIIVPAMELFQGGLREEYRECFHGFVAKIEEASAKVPNMDAAPEKQYRQAMEREIGARIGGLTEERGYSVRQIEISGLSENGENIKEEGVVLHILLKEGEKDGNFAKVQVDKIELERGKDDPGGKRKREKEARMRRAICEELGMREENVEVTIIEGLG